MPSELFDEIVDRFPGPARETESSYNFLNRADGAIWERVRDLLESWYAEYPDENKDLRNRFRQGAIDQHIGAWWELYIYTLFRRLGYSVLVHPEVSGGPGRPDFLVTRESEGKYIECRVLPSKNPLANSDNEAWLLECVNAAKNSEFMVDIDIDIVGTNRVPAKSVTGPIEEWLASLDGDAVIALIATGATAPERTFTFRDWQITLSAWPVAPDRREISQRLIGMYPVRTAWVYDIDQMRKALGRKGRRYGTLDKPLVVALLSWSSFSTDDDLTKALFGSIALKSSVNDPRSATPFRVDDGYWGQARGKRVAGVLFGGRLKPWDVTRELPRLWINPWSSLPVVDSTPFATVTIDDRGLVKSQPATTTGYSVFDLDPDWPS